MLTDERFRQAIGPHNEVGSLAHLPSPVAEPMVAYKLAVHWAHSAVGAVGRIAIAVAAGDRSVLSQYGDMHSKAEKALSQASAMRADATASSRIYR